MHTHLMIHNSVVLVNPWGAIRTHTERRQNRNDSCHWCLILQHQLKYFQGQILFYCSHLHSILLSVTNTFSLMLRGALYPRDCLSHTYIPATCELPWCSDSSEVSPFFNVLSPISLLQHHSLCLLSDCITLIVHMQNNELVSILKLTSR